jgi:hypothetical protein
MIFPYLHLTYRPGRTVNDAHRAAKAFVKSAAAPRQTLEQAYPRC